MTPPRMSRPISRRASLDTSANIASAPLRLSATVNGGRRTKVARGFGPGHTGAMPASVTDITVPASRFEDAEGYERLMGRWSRQLAPLLIEFSGLLPGE